MDAQIAKLNLKIADLEDKRKDYEKIAQSAGTQYNIGAIGALIGVILLIATSYWWLGVLLLVAGALAVFTQGAKRRTARKHMDEVGNEIKELRTQISGLLDES